MTIWIDEEKCDGCARCLPTCPYSALEIVDGKAVLTDRCTHCGSCLTGPCPQGALCSDGGEREIPDFSDHRGVWVLVEAAEGALHPVSLELVGKARKLADTLGEETAALVLGSGVEPLAGPLIAGGADRVHVVDHPWLDPYMTLPATQAAAAVLEANRPTILLVGATVAGRDLAPRLARRLALGLTADCTSLEIDPEERLLLQTRPAFGGNVMATIVTRYSRPQMASVRPGIFAPLAPDPARDGEVVVHDVDLDDEEDLGVVLARAMTVDGAETVDICQAKVVVAGGRGVGDAEGFKRLEQLATALGGEVGGTRVAHEEGWIPYERQIGQTGVTVRPELYIACGISGAVQHRAGVTDSRYIVAINSDPSAPIFEVADFGLVGDFRAIVPALLRALGAQAA